VKTKRDKNLLRCPAPSFWTICPTLGTLYISITREWFSPSPENDSLMTEIKKYSEWLGFCSEITQLVNWDDFINI
jgi:hypothetical protein